MPRIHLPVFTDRSPISSKRGAGERDVGADVARQRAAGERRAAVDHHRAASADARAAHEVELQRRIEPLADLGQRG
jgi:hypothetical protein